MNAQAYRETCARSAGKGCSNCRCGSVDGAKHGMANEENGRDENRDAGLDLLDSATGPHHGQYAHAQQDDADHQERLAHESPPFDPHRVQLYRATREDVEFALGELWQVINEKVAEVYPWASSAAREATAMVWAARLGRVR